MAATNWEELNEGQKYTFAKKYVEHYKKAKALYPNYDDTQIKNYLSGKVYSDTNTYKPGFEASCLSFIQQKTGDVSINIGETGLRANETARILDASMNNYKTSLDIEVANKTAEYNSANTAAIAAENKKNQKQADYDAFKNSINPPKKKMSLGKKIAIGLGILVGAPFLVAGIASLLPMAVGMTATTTGMWTLLGIGGVGYLAIKFGGGFFKKIRETSKQNKEEIRKQQDKELERLKQEKEQANTDYNTARSEKNLKNSELTKAQTKADEVGYEMYHQGKPLSMEEKRRDDLILENMQKRNSIMQDIENSTLTDVEKAKLKQEVENWYTHNVGEIYNNTSGFVSDVARDNFKLQVENNFKEVTNQYTDSGLTGGSIKTYKDIMIGRGKPEIKLTDLESFA